MPTTTPDPNGCPRCGRIDCPSLRDFCPPPECQLDPVDWRALYFAALRRHTMPPVAAPLVVPSGAMADYLASRGQGRAIWNTPEAKEYIDGLRSDDTAVLVEGMVRALRMDRTILEVHVASGEHGLDPGSRVAVTPLPDPHKGDRQG